MPSHPVRPVDRGVSTVLAVAFLVAITVIAAAVVGGYGFGLLDDALGTDAPQAAYEFDYDAEAGLLTVTQAGGRTFGSAAADSLFLVVSSGSATERYAWGAALGPDEAVSAGSSLVLDDGHGDDTGAFTFPGAFDAGDSVRVVFDDGDQSFTLASYELRTAARKYVNWRVPSDGLAARYPLDEAAGGVTDAVGSADGTATGATRGVGGQVGNAYSFDGDDHVALGRSFDRPESLNALSACAWFRTTETGTGEFDNWALLDFDRSEYFNLYVRGDTGEVGFSTSGPTATGVDHSTDTTFADGNWHLACATYDAGTDRKRIYVDGSLELDVIASNGDGLGTGTERWGFVGDGSEAGNFDGNRNGLHYEGRVDEVRLYEAALSASEVGALYDAGRGSGTAPTRGLTNYWPLDESATPDVVADTAGPGEGVVVGPTDRDIEAPVGSAYQFRDDSGYVALDRSFDSDDIGDVTACAWFRTSESDGSDNWALLDFDRSEYFNLYVQGDGQVGWSTSAEPGASGGDVDDLKTGGGFNDGTWHHVCGAYDEDKRIVVDGSVAADRAAPHGGAGLGTNTVRHGVIGDGSEADDYGELTDASNSGQRNEYYYDGAVDDVRLYERGLSTPEATRLWAFTGGATGGYETEPRRFPESVDLSALRVRSLGARLPSGTTATMQVRVDTNGDGTFDATSDPVSLGGGSSRITGLSGEADRVALTVTYTASGAATPTVDGIELTAD